MTYVLDANVLMGASRLYYAFDLAPGFWKWMASPSLVGVVVSVDAVKGEITAGKGSLVDGAKELPATFWLEASSDSVAASREIARWANDPARIFTPAALAEFMAAADFHVIAHAMDVAGTVVTREQSAPEARKKIKIPDVCNAFGVACLDPFSAYRTLGLRLS